MDQLGSDFGSLGIVHKAFKGFESVIFLLFFADLFNQGKDQGSMQLTHDQVLCFFYSLMIGGCTAAFVSVVSGTFTSGGSALLVFGH